MESTLSWQEALVGCVAVVSFCTMVCFISWMLLKDGKGDKDDRYK